MKSLVLVALVIAGGGLCASPQPLTATMSVAASTTAQVGGAAQLVVQVTNTGPSITHLGLVFRTRDQWYALHAMKDLSGCTVSAESSAFDCGDLGVGASKTFSFTGVAMTAGKYHYELALRELVQPFDWVNDHPDGADAQTWDETIS